MTILQKLSKDDSYGMVLRSKGILQDRRWMMDSVCLFQGNMKSVKEVRITQEESV